MPKVSCLDDCLTIPDGLKQAGKVEQLAFITGIARVVVEKCTLVDSAFSTTDTTANTTANTTADTTADTIADTITDIATDATNPEDGVYNYSRVFCHYAAMLMEFRDAWGEADGSRIENFDLHLKPQCLKSILGVSC